MADGSTRSLQTFLHLEQIYTGMLYGSTLVLYTPKYSVTFTPLDFDQRMTAAINDDAGVGRHPSTLWLKAVVAFLDLVNRGE